MRRSLVAAALMALSPACGDNATNEPDSSALEMETRVVFDDLPGSSPIAKTGVAGSEEECTTSCSLAKHHVPELTEHGFEVAVRAYGKEVVDAPSESLETLLFYGSRTIELMAEIGTEELSEEHLAFLRKELSRDKAWVSLRMVDDDEKVRVSYGPTLVPLGAKQHLAAVGENLKSMEFNGTVMRTGVNYLWSRY
ncbi:MAG: hypothetical protein JKY56_18720 [Kofleriaceae bacterium]|nr:hypothetical protein [Kofleriaceae bacterium]